MLYKVVEILWVEYLLAEFGTLLLMAPELQDLMDKWMLQADLAHQIGLGPTLHVVLIVVEIGDRGG
jgi:hypothetical protein